MGKKTKQTQENSLGTDGNSVQLLVITALALKVYCFGKSPFPAFFHPIPPPLSGQLFPLVARFPAGPGPLPWSRCCAVACVPPLSRQPPPRPLGLVLLQTQCCRWSHVCLGAGGKRHPAAESGRRSSSARGCLCVPGSAGPEGLKSCLLRIKVSAASSIPSVVGVVVGEDAPDTPHPHLLLHIVMF